MSFCKPSLCGWEIGGNNVNSISIKNETCCIHCNILAWSGMTYVFSLLTQIFQVTQHWLWPLVGWGNARLCPFFLTCGWGIGSKSICVLYRWIRWTTASVTMSVPDDLGGDRLQNIESSFLTDTADHLRNLYCFQLPQNFKFYMWLNLIIES